MEKSFRLYLRGLLIFRGLYSRRTAETKMQSSVLFFFMLMLFTHSILVYSDVLLSNRIGIIEFWIPKHSPKAPLGYIVGLLLSIIYFSIIRFINQRIEPKTKIRLMRLCLSKRRSRLFSIYCLVLNLAIFFSSLVLIAYMMIKNR
jgi:hypothetical protein